MASHQGHQYIYLNNYVLNKSQRIGRGSSGIVYLGHHRNTKDKVAIKRLDVSQMADKMSRIWNEIQIMKSINHPSIVRLYDVFIDLENNYLYLIMEYCDGSDLSDYTKKYTLDLTEVHKIMTQIKDGLLYLRKKGIMHRDLKPQNILLHEGNVKLADFGLSVIIEGESQLLNTMCGSPLYMSPEIIEHQKYTAKSDLWSIGVILYQLIYHKHPYNNNCQNIQELTKEVRDRAITYPDFPPIDPLTMDLMHGLLNKNCHNRITWEEFFSHQWFNHQISLSTFQNSFSPPGNSFLFRKNTDQSLNIGSSNEHEEGSESISSDDDIFFSLSEDEQFFPEPKHEAKAIIYHQITDSQSMNESASASASASASGSSTRLLSLTDYLINDYQKKDHRPDRRRTKEQPVPVYGTSAPIRSHNIDYSPSNLNFGSVGSSLIKYANRSFSWFKSSLEL